MRTKEEKKTQKLEIKIQANWSLCISLGPGGQWRGSGPHVPDVFIQCIELIALQAAPFENVDHSSLDTAGKQK